jgi:hypothetical protein
MKTFLPRFLLIAAVLGLATQAAAAPTLPSSDAKKLAERYALTKTRIQELLGARLHPQAMPATALPNPFYHGQVVVDTGPQSDPVKTGPVPDAPDLTDADTLAKYLAGLKVNGYLIRDGQPHLAVNDTVCKLGDVLTVGSKDHPVFLHLVDLNPQEATFRLNDITQVLSLKK